jgi:uncharacterized glyoxalase superfamily protein PhnB
MATRTKSRRPPVRRAAARKIRPRVAAKKKMIRRQPETLRLRSIVPSYTVNNLDNSIAWYCDGLGFIVKDRWEEKGKLLGVMLAAGSCELGLSQDDFAKGRDRVKGVGCRIHVSTTQPVDALAERIRAYGGRIIMEPGDYWGSRSFAVEDPDGFKITFEQARRS